MPQFDILTFYSQIFWLTVIFFGFYNFTLRIFLPKIAAVLKTRKKKLLLGSTGVQQYNDKQIFEKTTQNKLIQNFTEDLFNKFFNQESKQSIFTFIKIKVFTNFYAPLVSVQQAYYFDSVFLIKRYINNL
jgi:hypothetical protein